MTTRKELSAAAKQGFSAQYGITCHDAVLEWLVNSKYVGANADESLGLKNADTQKPAIYAKALVNESDKYVGTLGEANKLVQGDVLGFWKDGALMHSAVVADKTIIAGANNGGVLDPQGDLPKIHNNLFAIFLTSQMKWNANGTIGDGNYKLYAAAPETVAARING